MQLSAQSIRARCIFRSDDFRSGFSMIFPYHEQFLQSASYDLHLGGNVVIPHATGKPIDLREPRTLRSEDESIDLSANTVLQTCVALRPGQRALGRTVEYVRIPTDLQARLDGKSSLGRDGLEVHKTAGVFDAGFIGHPVVELKNDGEDPWILYQGMPIAQMSFFQLDSYSEKPYSRDRNHYQEQMEAVGNRTVDSSNPLWSYSIRHLERPHFHSGQIVRVIGRPGPYGCVTDEVEFPTYSFYEVEIEGRRWNYPEWELIPL